MEEEEWSVGKEGEEEMDILDKVKYHDRCR
jgi:hypothetical protein